MSDGFQFKLYRLVTEGGSGVTWNNVGDSIYIDVPKFKKFLSRDNNFCKSKIVNSFIRQLNLYGFKIVIELDGEDDKQVHHKNLKEYSNSYFLRGRVDLLSKITRNGRDMKLKNTSLPTAALPSLPTQNWGKRKRRLTKQEQFNPAAKRIKQEVIDDSYGPYESANQKIDEQFDPVSKKIKQEIIDTSYEPIQSISLSGAESDIEEGNAEYKEISKTMLRRTRQKDRVLVSILKPSPPSTSKVLPRSPSPAAQAKSIGENISRNIEDIPKSIETNTENSSVVINSAEPQNIAPAAPTIQVSPPTPAPAVIDECTIKNDSRNADDLPEPSKTMVVEDKFETNVSTDTDFICKLTEEKFRQMELECSRQIKATSVLTNAAISDVFSEDLCEMVEVVILDQQDISKNTVNVRENRDHQYARLRDEELNQNMVMENNQDAETSVITSECEEIIFVTTNDSKVNEAIDDEEVDFDLLPWRKRRTSSYAFSNILPRFNSVYKCLCPNLINKTHYALTEDATDPALKPGSGNLMLISSLYMNQAAFTRAILHDYFRIGYDRLSSGSSGHGEPKPKTLHEVLDYSVKK